jgi:penicillin-binding protein 1A
MREEGAASEPEIRKALSMPVRVVSPPRPQNAESAYYAAEVLRLLLPRYGEDRLSRWGMTVHTAMDPLMQRAAFRAVRRARHQGALAALDPLTGRVLALVGGRDYGESQFNRATQSRRQAGSAFKPFIYGAALEAGWTPVSLLLDEPKTFTGQDGNPWKPRNFNGVYKGTVTFREALSHSLNSATLDLVSRVGPEKPGLFALRLGITGEIPSHFGIALGVAEVSPLEMAQAFAAFANGGWRAEPQIITAVQDAQGLVLDFPTPEKKQVLSPALAYLITSLLETAVKEGTGRPLPAWGWTKTAAGKTGTTNEGRDAWFVA